MGILHTLVIENNRNAEKFIRGLNKLFNFSIPVCFSIVNTLCWSPSTILYSNFPRGPGSKSVATSWYTVKFETGLSTKVVA